MTLPEGRCASQALVLGRQWKTCIRERGHTLQEPHVWLEAFTVVGRRPVLVTWFGPRTTTPTVSEVWVPAGPGDTPGALAPGEDDRPEPIDAGAGDGNPITGYPLRGSRNDLGEVAGGG